MPRTTVKIDIYDIIENAIELLKKRLTDTQKSGNKRKVKALKEELERLNEELDWT
jgi:DNA-binding LacI/PurR family transcriptional regulator